MHTERRVSADNVDLLARVLGTFDENLNIICRELSVVCRVEGLDFIISGEEDKVRLAEEVIGRHTA